MVVAGEKVTDAAPDGERYSEAGNANRLIKLVENTMRYVLKWDRFLIYENGVWHMDNHKDALATEVAKGVARELFASYEQLNAELLVDTELTAEQKKGITKQLNEMKSWAHTCERKSAIATMLSLTKGVEGILIEHDDIETNGYLFNMPNGTLDFAPVRDDPNAAPIFRKHDPDDLLMLQSPIPYEPDAECPLWDSCLKTWQPDPAIRRYLQMRAGACALGINTETFDVDYGTGRNGKSKFHGAIRHVLGEYSIVPHKSLLMSHRFDEHATIYADLFRKRCAVATETKSGETLDEESVKSLTGGDPIKGRRMREDPWEFLGTHTLIIHTNHRPKIKGTDPAIWARVHLVPWLVFIPPDDRDPDLAVKLECEAPGILRWILNGALMYLREGWKVPEKIKVATDDYREEEDVVGRFIVDSLVVGDPSDMTYFDVIKNAADDWIVDEGMAYEFSPRQITDALKDRGAEQGRRVNGKSGGGLPMKRTEWHGVRLVEVEDESPGGTINLGKLAEQTVREAGRRRTKS